jgi:hypothetical protein
MLNRSDLLNNLETNVEYFNKPGSPTLDNPYWARWNINGWARKKGLGERQRLTTYGKTSVPKVFVPGLSGADRDSPDNLSYYHKRNFTLFLSYPRAGQNPNDQWPNQAFSAGSGSRYIDCRFFHLGHLRRQYHGSATLSI